MRLPLLLSALLVGSPAGAEPPQDVSADVEAACAGQAAVETGFDPRATPRPLPRMPRPPAAGGAGNPALPSVDPGLAQAQARWDAEAARYRRALEACLAAHRVGD